MLEGGSRRRFAWPGYKIVHTCSPAKRSTAGRVFDLERHANLRPGPPGLIFPVQPHQVEVYPVERRKTNAASEDVTVVVFHIRTITCTHRQPIEWTYLGPHAHVL